MTINQKLLKQDKYTMAPGQLNLSQQYDNNCQSKMIFEQKLVISKIWAKNTKNRQKWEVFPNFFGG